MGNSKSSSTAIMASHLIAAGWELHLNSNPEKSPSIWKASRQGDATTVESCALTIDDVIDLHQGGSIEKHRSFEVGNETVTVFRHRSYR